MKRLLATAICLSLLYASAVWAFAGCDNLAAASASHHGAGQDSAHHHDGSSTPHHPDGGKIHCVNLFGAFVGGTRVGHETELRIVASAAVRHLHPGSVFEPSAAALFAFEPPGGLAALSPPLYLLHSVIRI